MDNLDVGRYVFLRRRPGIIRSIKELRENRTHQMLHMVDVDYIDGYDHPSFDRVIWEREVNCKVFPSLDVPDVGGTSIRPDRPERYEAFIDALRWTSNSIFQVDDGGLTSRRSPVLGPWFSSVQVEDYQLFPVVQALSMPRVNMLLADDVGLGKTIEAGLIVQELVRQRRIRRVLIVCPSSLQIQWQDEMKEKFNIDFTILNSEQVYTIQKELGLDANPWTVYPRVITSMDYLKQRDVLGRFITGSNNLLAKDAVALPWDLLIVDEAHNFSPSRMADESDRCSMLRQVSPLFEHRLFLTATPHNGYTLSFTGLLELLDPVRFQQRTSLGEEDMKQLSVVMVRRMKEELNRGRDPPRFAPRRVVGIPVQLTNKEVDLYRKVRKYREEANKALARLPRKERVLGDFIFSLLTKRLLSSSYAFARTWWDHVEGYGLDGFDYDQAKESKDRAEAPVSEDEEKERRERDAVRHGAAWLRRYKASIGPYAEEVSNTLESLGWGKEVARGNLGKGTKLPKDGRWEALLLWVRTNLMVGEQYKADERAIIFTEYKDTQDYLVERFRRENIRTPALKTLFGGASAEARREVKAEFNDPRSLLRILVATDAASEGLNLQTSCRYVIHQEIPWNPMRMEQRNGRVDRHGQYREVTVHHFVSDQVEDLKFLGFVARKVETVKSDLGSVGKVLDEAVMEYFSKGQVDEADVEKRIEFLRQVSQDKEDLKNRAPATELDYSSALRTYEDVSRELDLSEGHLSRLLSEAAVLENGKLGKVGDGVYRFEKVPPNWEKLVATSLLLVDRSRDRAQPKIVFSPDRVEETINGIKLLRPMPDTRLVMLGHPLMARSLSAFRKRLWMPASESRLARWTVIPAADLPEGVPRAYVVSFLVSVHNELGEQHRTGLIDVPLFVKGGRITIEMGASSLGPLSSAPIDDQAVLSSGLDDVMVEWSDVTTTISNARERVITQVTELVSKEMAADLVTQRKELEELYELRKNALKEGTDKRYLDRLRKELDQAEDKMRQRTLSEELNIMRKQHYEEMRKLLEEAEWERQKSNIEHLLDWLERDRSRVLDKVLPRRYSLPDGGVKVQVAGVKVLMANGGGR